MKSDQEKYHELSYYTLNHPDPSFIHQHIVDAYAAQHADENIKPITLVFALIGLYLHVEKNYSGRDVQLAHIQLAKNRKEWPKFSLPEQKGSITISNVLNALPGPKRDEMINKWCVSVWKAYCEYHTQVINLVKNNLNSFQIKNPPLTPQDN